MELLVSWADLVVSRVTYRGTHVVDFEGVPARGENIEVTGIDIFRFSAGRVVDTGTKRTT